MSEFANIGLKASAIQTPSEDDARPYQATFTISFEDGYDFSYGIYPVKYPVPNRPTVDDGQEFYYRLEMYLLEGLQGNDLLGYSKEQVINDILDRYERHRAFLHLNRETPGNRPVFE